MPSSEAENVWTDMVFLRLRHLALYHGPCYTATRAAGGALRVFGAKGPDHRMTLAEYPAVVAVVHQEGCPACEEFLPRLRARASRSCVPTVIIDARRNEALANLLVVQYTPTTFALRHGHILDRLEGGGEDEKVEAVYARMERACEAGG